MSVIYNAVPGAEVTITGDVQASNSDLQNITNLYAEGDALSYTAAVAVGKRWRIISYQLYGNGGSSYFGQYTAVPALVNFIGSTGSGVLTSMSGSCLGIISAGNKLGYACPNAGSTVSIQYVIEDE